jgi:hypothetical protein
MAGALKMLLHLLDWTEAEETRALEVNTASLMSRKQRGIKFTIDFYLKNMDFQKQTFEYFHQSIIGGGPTRLIIRSLLLVFILQACDTYRDGIPAANQPNSIRDSWYFCRDTLNFYQADLSDQVVSVIDSVVANSEIEENKYWVLEVDPRAGELKEFCLSIIYVEKVLYYNSQEQERVFKAFLHKGIPILIIDSRNTIRINPEKPLVKIYNPGKMDDWLFRLDGNRDCFKLKNENWASVRRF